jgi:hypothetical protein
VAFHAPLVAEHARAGDGVLGGLGDPLALDEGRKTQQPEQAEHGAARWMEKAAMETRDAHSDGHLAG